MVSNPSSFTVQEGETNKTNNQDWMNNIPASKARALKFFVPRCRNAVTSRERTKSLLIRTIHCFRLAYRRLAQLLVWDGKIPDADLVFFLTHSDLRDLVQSGRGAALIAKAVRRRKLYPEMDGLVFPELSLGIPRPIQDSQTEDLVRRSFISISRFSSKF